MVKVTRPKSLFGKLPYYKEQFLMIPVADMTNRGAFLIDPFAVGMYFPIIERLPIKRRKRLARKYLVKARNILKEVGV